MKLKPKQRKKLLVKARKHAGVCCVVLRNVTGDVQPAAGVLSGECSACGRTLRVNPKTAGSEVVKRFFHCVSNTNDFCEHFVYWEQDGVRVPHNLKGDRLETAPKCNCRKPPVVLQGEVSSASPA